MNRRQEIVLFVAVAALIITWLFPPWIFRRSIVGDDHSATWAYIEHHFIFNPPGVGAFDWHSLLLTDLVIIAVGSLLVCALRTRS